MLAEVTVFRFAIDLDYIFGILNFIIQHSNTNLKPLKTYFVSKILYNRRMPRNSNITSKTKLLHSPAPGTNPKRISASKTECISVRICRSSANCRRSPSASARRPARRKPRGSLIYAGCARANKGFAPRSLLPSGPPALGRAHNCAV